MGLAAKMVQIMADVDRLPKDATNDFHRYQYTSDAQVYNAVRKAMIAHGVAVYAKMPDAEQTASETAKGKPQVHTLAKFVFVLVDAESGEREECPWMSEADDQNDKGINKTATAALKYWLLKTFIVPTGDDPDAEEHDAPKSDRRIQTGPGTPGASTRASKPATRAQQDAPAVDAAEGDADLLKNLLNSAKAFDPNSWPDLMPHFIAAGLAKDDFEANGRLRHALGIEDGKAAWREVVAKVKELNPTVGTLAQTFNARAMGDKDATLAAAAAG